MPVPDRPKKQRGVAAAADGRGAVHREDVARRHPVIEIREHRFLDFAGVRGASNQDALLIEIEYDADFGARVVESGIEQHARHVQDDKIGEGRQFAGVGRRSRQCVKQACQACSLMRRTPTRWAGSAQAHASHVKTSRRCRYVFARTQSRSKMVGVHRLIDRTPGDLSSLAGRRTRYLSLAAAGERYRVGDECAVGGKHAFLASNAPARSDESAELCVYWPKVHQPKRTRIHADNPFSALWRVAYNFYDSH